MTSQPISPLSEKERADSYPYQAPLTSYLMQKGSYQPVTSFTADELAGRVALLSVGSNRSPQQLLRKFGKAAYLPVTRAILHDCDIIHSACFSYYGAVPCSAFPSKGTKVALNAVWLTSEQLQIMHDTEAVGIAYDYCRWDERVVEIQDAPQPEAIYGYATRLGYFADEGGMPFALTALPAANRRYTALSQAQARHALYEQLPASLRGKSCDDFMGHLVQDKSFRLTVNETLSQIGQAVTHGPWRLESATPQDADSFL